MYLLSFFSILIWLFYYVQLLKRLKFSQSVFVKIKIYSNISNQYLFSVVYIIFMSLFQILSKHFDWFYNAIQIFFIKIKYFNNFNKNVLAYIVATLFKHYVYLTNIILYLVLRVDILCLTMNTFWHNIKISILIIWPFLSISWI